MIRNMTKKVHCSAIALLFEFFIWDVTDIYGEVVLQPELMNIFFSAQKLAILSMQILELLNFF